jgi:hypoxanthine-guanine phosphoribosyltransferase
MADLMTIQSMLRAIEHQTRNNIIGEIQAFANDYHHHIDGRDVIIVDQLIDFLRGVPSDK